ncbi:MFS transporter [Rhodothermus marinus]|uniref:MFS transporter n=1 Tax=Rhodothermus marinus TaxID=29549 RepID=UPI000AD38388|nr:MFS transporter [Rhodothermus marinus]
MTASGLIVALLSPYLGALADQGGYRKRFLLAVTVLCVLSTAALYIPQSGEVLAALVLFTIANVAFELGNVFYNAFFCPTSPRRSESAGSRATAGRWATWAGCSAWWWRWWR